MPLCNLIFGLWVVRIFVHPEDDLRFEHEFPGFSLEDVFWL